MEKLILSAFLHDAEFNATLLPHISPEYFEDTSNQIIIESALQYCNEHKQLPPKIVLETIIESRLNIPQSIYEKSKENLLELYSTESKDEVKQASMQWKLDESLKWLIERRSYIVIEKSIQIMSGTYKENGVLLDKSAIPDMMQKAISITFDTTIGHDYIEDADSRFDFMHKKVNKIPFKIPILNKITLGGVEKKSLNTFMGGTGCHSVGTPILMVDGTIKNVEDITIDDKLMGDDGQHRDIYKLIRNKGHMYDVTIKSTGEKFRVNDEHILSLVDTDTKNISNISIKDYLNKSKWFKHRNKSYYNKTPIEFVKENLKIDPYFMGLYLGDGHTHSIGITTMDKEIELYLKNYLTINYPSAKVREVKQKNNKATGYYISDPKCEIFGKRYNSIAKDFSEYGLIFRDDITRTKCSDKFIPKEYKHSSIEDRLQLLAGLIDSDGHKSKNGYYSFTFSSEQITKDIQYIARSLAMYSKLGTKIVNGKLYYKVSVCTSPDSEQHIPCKLPRKQTDRNFIKSINPLHSSFSLEYVGVEDYYGFAISGNNLYCMGNFMVTHNTGKSLVMCSLASDYISLGYNVLYITLEMAEEKISTRIDANLLNIELDQLKNIPKSTYLKKFDKFKEEGYGKLIVKEYPTASAGVGQFRFLMRELENKQEFIPDIVFIDYLGIASSSRYKSDNMYQMGKSVSEEFRGLAVEKNVAIWTAVQSNRGSQSSSDVEMSDIAESFGINMVCDFILAIITTPELKTLGQLRFKQLKNRYEDMGNFLSFQLNVITNKMKILQDDDYTKSHPQVDERKKPDELLPSKSKFDNMRKLK